MVSALSVALYGMFIAIIVPPAKENRVLAGIVILSMGLSFLFTRLPVLSQISLRFPHYHPDHSDCRGSSLLLPGF